MPFYVISNKNVEIQLEELENLHEKSRNDTDDFKVLLREFIKEFKDYKKNHIILIKSRM